jgi:hypothetical protein
MNKFELESLLKKARLPEITEESLELFPRQVAARLKRNEPGVRRAQSFLPRLAWAGGLAAGVAMALAIGHWHGRGESGISPENDSLASLKLVHETLAMFPNQVRAIVENEHGMNLVLSDNADVPASPPLYVRICDGEHCSSFVTFSGQEIQVGGQTVTVLAEARGGIILEGNQFVWSNTERTVAGNHLKIQARNLGSTVM